MSTTGNHIADGTADEYWDRTLPEEPERCTLCRDELPIADMVFMPRHNGHVCFPCYENPENKQFKTITMNKETIVFMKHRMSVRFESEPVTGNIKKIQQVQLHVKDAEGVEQCNDITPFMLHLLEEGYLSRTTFEKLLMAKADWTSKPEPHEKV